MREPNDAHLPLLFLLLASTIGCGQAKPVEADRYAASDRWIERISQNIDADQTLEEIVEIDHSRLGAEAGSVMPPARVLIFSDARLESELVALNPLTAIDLPLRALAYEVAPNGESSVIYNSFAFLQSRYGLEDAAPELADRYNAAMASALRGISEDRIRRFENDEMQPDGIVTIDSPYDFDETLERVWKAIDAQDDTVRFGELDFQQRARAEGIELPPARLLLFGGPAPGAKAMATANTLGLDAFCQKFLVWQSADGESHLSFNDLLALADRQGVSKTVPLRVINRRLAATFNKALEPETK